MPSKNKVNIMGHLGFDPELRYTPSGKAVCNFTVACTKKVQDKEFTEWVRCVAWERLAEIVSEYAHKGSLVDVEGALQTQTYEKNGEKRYTTEVNVREFKLLDRREGQANRQTRGHANRQSQERASPLGNEGFDDDSDIPF